MPAITITNFGGSGAKAVTEVTLTASDTFSYVSGDIMVLRNATAGALTPTLDGADGTIFPVPGLGDVNVAAGFSAGAIPAGQVRAIRLDTISAYLAGVVTVTGGTGLVAFILRQ